ncbi:hypothetical protein D9758_008379 [Tetrapyrgos nigripes]|uniref:Uncharacterized protein n=1 Tax=Tetrapyrgos nigripes TaxID=182062 RepID=A0A8H5LN09_9AGAR|nr:hypothetical protein D9758_008379 [Tetrapyrgos nigripes]
MYSISFVFANVLSAVAVPGGSVLGLSIPDLTFRKSRRSLETFPLTLGNSGQLHAEALLELYDPSLSIYSSSPFEEAAGANVLVDGDGAVGDPASLGVFAVLLGGSNESYADGAKRTMEYLINGAPRWANGAISHRVAVAELWADFLYMAPPFLAYYAVSTWNLSLLMQAVEQYRLYREVVQLGQTLNKTLPYSDPQYGIWRHIIGPQKPDPGLWSTGNAWAVAGMARSLATVIKAPRSLFYMDCGYHCSSSHPKADAIDSLTSYIKEILDGALSSPLDNGLLRNYLNVTLESGHGYGEVSGSTLRASVIYRMVILRPDVFLYGEDGSRYLEWAEDRRHTISLGGHITANGTATPAVNPLNWFDTVPYTAGSPEGNNFVVLMYTAWRDCVWEGICSLY